MNPLPLIVALALHPLHTTHTTITMERGNRVAIEIRAFTDDLHSATARHGGVVNDSALASYVRGAVRLITGAGQPIQLTWDGTTPDGDVTRIRLHGILPTGLTGTSLRQAMQTDLFTDQVNVVLVRAADRRISLLFTPGDQAKPLS